MGNGQSSEGLGSYLASLPRGWIKANTDGLAIGSRGSSACGGCFHNSKGEFLVSLGLALGYQTAY